MYKVGIVCEGKADGVVIEAVLNGLKDDYKLLPIQPPGGRVGGDAGPLGGGWKGVQRWCEQESRHGRLSDLAERTDLLIIQVDSDVAGEKELDRARPCPPPADSANEVRSAIREWLGVEQLPDKVVLCVPSMASETWALVGLFPNNAAVVVCDPPPADGVCIECRADIKALLRARSEDIGAKLVTLKQGRLKNHASAYRKVQERITEGWNAVVASCSEARRFDTELRAAMT